MTIQLKNEAQLQKMRKAGKVLAKVLKTMKEIAKKGLTTKELDKIAEKIILEHDMIPAFKGYRGFPATICSSINEEVVHTIPSDRVIQDGDILTVDCGVLFAGYNTDAAVTIAIGKVDPKIKHFIEINEKALYAGISQVKPGNKTGDIGNAIQNLVEKNAYFIIKNLTGHGIGEKLHEEPTVYNYGKSKSGISLKPGMTIAIEPIISMGTSHIKTLQDGWNIVTKDGSLASQFEHTVVVTNSGYEILTF